MRPTWCRYVLNSWVLDCSSSFLLHDIHDTLQNTAKKKRSGKSSEDVCSPTECTCLCTFLMCTSTVFFFWSSAEFFFLFICFRFFFLLLFLCDAHYSVVNWVILFIVFPLFVVFRCSSHSYIPYSVLLFVLVCFRFLFFLRFIFFKLSFYAAISKPESKWATAAKLFYTAILLRKSLRLFLSLFFLSFCVTFFFFKSLALYVMKKNGLSIRVCGAH